MGFLFGLCCVIAVVCGGIWLVITVSIKNSERKEKVEEENKKEKMQQALLKQLEDKSWKFPVTKAQKAFQENNIKYPVESELVSVADKIIIDILNQFNVPSEFHTNYVGEEIINEFLLELAEKEQADIVRSVQKIAKEQKFTMTSSEASYQKAKIIMEKALEKFRLPKEKYDFYMTR
jgi:hypothetical protein